MLSNVVCVVLLSFSLTVFGLLPGPGGPYLIQNVANKHVFTVQGANPSPGTLITGDTKSLSSLNAQEWYITEESIESSSSAIYSFVCPGVGAQGVYAHAENALASPLTTQTAPIPLKVSDLTGDGRYRIAFSIGTFAVTTDVVAGRPLTMREVNPLNSLQQWVFVPQAGFRVNATHPFQKVATPAVAAEESVAK